MPSTATARTAPRHGRSRSAAAPARRRPAPAHRPRPATAPASPSRATATGAALRFLEARTSGLLDRLLRGRLWVGCIGGLLAGIVFLNVSLLELNQDIARTSAKAGVLDRQNSALRMQLAGLDSTERIQRIAERRGMLLPEAGNYRYLTPRPGLDGRLAAERATAPNGSGVGVTSYGAAASAAPTTRAYRPATTTAPRGAYTPPSSATAAPSHTSAAPTTTTPPTAAAPVAGRP